MKMDVTTNEQKSQEEEGDKDKDEERERLDKAKKNLIDNINDKNTKRLIECLDVEQIGVGGAESTRKNIRKCIQTWKNKEDKQRDAITFLNQGDIKFAGHIGKWMLKSY